MKQHIKTLIAGGVLALVLIGMAMRGPLEDGYAAYQRGDYAKEQPHIPSDYLSPGHRLCGAARAGRQDDRVQRGLGQQPSATLCGE